MNRLLNKVAIVTGGASEIGRGIAEMYVKEGASVVVLDISPEGQKVADEIQARFIQTDVSNASDVDKAVSKVIADFGKIDILVNNAGIEQNHSLLETSEEEWDRVIRVNLKSVFLMSKKVVEHFVQQGGGVIVNMGSITAKIGFLNYPGYTATKGAIHALTRQMAMELSQYKIRVNSIYPGTIRTPLAMRNFEAGGTNLEEAIAESEKLHLVRRLGEPEDVAYMAVYLGSEEASFITGQEFGVEGGFLARGGFA